MGKSISNISTLKFLNSMKHLWAPWRMKYIEKHGKVDECVFCVAKSKTDSAENLIAFRGKNAYVILNRYPYTSGHLMVIPFDHRSNLEELNAETRGEMMELASLCTTILRKVYKQNPLTWASISVKPQARACWDMSTFTLCRAGLGIRISCPRWERRVFSLSLWKILISECARR